MISLLLTPFPYAFVFRERRSEIIILALAHQRRRPGYWRQTVLSRELDFRHRPAILRSFVVGPHTNDLHRLVCIEYLIDKPVLNVDPA